MRREAPRGDGLSSHTHFLLSLLPFMFSCSPFIFRCALAANGFSNIEILDLINENVLYVPPIFKQ